MLTRLDWPDTCTPTVWKLKPLACHALASIRGHLCCCACCARGRRELSSTRHCARARVAHMRCSPHHLPPYHERPGEPYFGPLAMLPLHRSRPGTRPEWTVQPSSRPRRCGTLHLTAQCSDAMRSITAQRELGLTIVHPLALIQAEEALQLAHDLSVDGCCHLRPRDIFLVPHTQQCGCQGGQGLECTTGDSSSSRAVQTTGSDTCQSAPESCRKPQSS